MTTIGDMWKTLSTGGDVPEEQEGWQTRRIHPDSVSDVFVAFRFPDRIPALLLEVDSAVIGVVGEYPSARGFEVFAEPIVPGPRGRTRLCLVLDDDHYFDVFEVLADDVAENELQ